MPVAFVTVTLTVPAVKPLPYNLFSMSVVFMLALSAVGVNTYPELPSPLQTPFTVAASEMVTLEWPVVWLYVKLVANKKMRIEVRNREQKEGVFGVWAGENRDKPKGVSQREADMCSTALKT